MANDGVRGAYGPGRVTPQRALIAREVAAIGGAFSVDELVARVRAVERGIGVATVYRAVSAMESTGWLERVGDRDGSALFARCAAGSAHHHHVVCTTCGRVEAAGCPLPDLARSTPTGFLVTHHEVTMYGLCPACRAGSKA